MCSSLFAMGFTLQRFKKSQISSSFQFQTYFCNNTCWFAGYDFYFMASEFVEAIYVVFASTMSYLITNIIIKLTSVESIKKNI